MSVESWLTLWVHECVISERYRQGQFSEGERGYLSVADANKFHEEWEELDLLIKLTQHI